MSGSVAAENSGSNLAGLTGGIRSLIEGLPSFVLESDVPLSSFLLDERFASVPGISSALTLELGLLVLFLGLSTLFSVALRTFLYLDASSIDALLQETDSRAVRVQKLLERPGRLFLTLALTITLAHAGAILMSVLLAFRLGSAIAIQPLAAVVLTVLVVGIVLLIISRIVPHLLRPTRYLQVATALSLPVQFFERLLLVMTFPLEAAIRAVYSRLDRTWPPRSIIAHSLSTVSYEEPDVEEQEEQTLIDSVVAFRDTTVREIMISRMDMVGLPVTATLDEALEIIRTSGHSRLPLYEEHLDHILGVVYTKDILPYLDPSTQNGVKQNRERVIEWRRLARPAMFVPLDRPLNTILQQFREKKTHLAIVVDEYGGTAGIVTLEDVLEEIVGDIRDEHDVEDVMARKVGTNVFRVDARINLDELAVILDRDFDADEFDFETLGGLVYHCAGDIPAEGDEVRYEDLRMKVVRVDNHRIVEVLIFVDSEPVMQDAPME